MPINSDAANQITPQPRNAVHMKRIERAVVPTIFGIATLAPCSRPLKVALTTPIARKTI